MSEQQDPRRPAHPESVLRQELIRLEQAVDRIHTAYAVLLEDHEAEVARLRVALARNRPGDADLARLLAARLAIGTGRGSTSAKDVRVLAVLLACMEGPRTVSQLQEDLDLPAATASEWAGAAVTQGLLMRSPGKTGRETLLSPTPKGRRALQRPKKTGGSDGVEADQEQDQA